MPAPFDDILLPRDLPLSCGIVAHAPSVYHGWLLEAVSSPYFAGGKVTREDFAVAACLLSRTTAELIAEGLEKALAACRPKALKMAKFYAADTEAFKRDSSALSAFLAESAKGLRSRRKDEGRHSPLPYCYTLSIILRLEFGMTDAEALAYPLKRAIIDYQILRELRGEKSLISSSTAHLIDEIRRKAEEEKAP